MKMNLWLYIHLKLEVLIMVQKIIDSLYVSLPIADKIDQKGGAPSSTGLGFLAWPYETAGLEPTG